MNYQEHLLKNYILSEIYNIEKKELLEEGKITDWFKSKFSDIAGDTDIIKACKEFLEKTKYKKDRKTQRQRKGTQMALELEQNKRSRFKIFALAALMAASLIGKGINNPSPQDFRNAQEVAEKQVESNSPTNQNTSSDKAPDIVRNTTKALEEMSEEQKRKALLAFFGANDADLEEQQPQQASKDYLYGSKDYFYDWIESAPQIAGINEMTPEQYDAFVKQFSKFLEEEAFKMNRSEANNADNLLFLLSNSDHATSENDEGVLSSKVTIRALKSDLDAVQSFRRSMAHFGAEYGLNADQEGWSPEKTKAVKSYMQKSAKDKLENLSYLQDLALKRGESGEKYDNLIDKFEEVFFNTYGYEIEDGSH